MGRISIKVRGTPDHCKANRKSNDCSLRDCTHGRTRRGSRSCESRPLSKRPHDRSEYSSPALLSRTSDNAQTVSSALPSSMPVSPVCQFDFGASKLSDEQKLQLECVDSFSRSPSTAAKDVHGSFACTLSRKLSDDQYSRPSISEHWLGAVQGFGEPSFETRSCLLRDDVAGSSLFGPISSPDFVDTIFAGNPDCTHLVLPCVSFGIRFDTPFAQE